MFLGFFYNYLFLKININYIVFILNIMIANFGGFTYFISFLIILSLLGYYSYRFLFTNFLTNLGFKSEINTLGKMFGSYNLSLFIVGIIILFKNNGPNGMWSYFLIISLASFLICAINLLSNLGIIKRYGIPEYWRSVIASGLIFILSIYISLFGIYDSLYYSFIN